MAAETDVSAWQPQPRETQTQTSADFVKRLLSNRPQWIHHPDLQLCLRTRRFPHESKRRRSHGTVLYSYGSWARIQLDNRSVVAAACFFADGADLLGLSAVMGLPCVSISRRRRLLTSQRHLQGTVTSTGFVDHTTQPALFFMEQQILVTRFIGDEQQRARALKTPSDSQRHSRRSALIRLLTLPGPAARARQHQRVALRSTSWRDLLAHRLWSHCGPNPRRYSA